MYRVFLSYNTSREEMVVVWRLQTLAAASGLHLDVPDPVQRADWVTVTRMIDEADAVIAFITTRTTAQVNKEITYALERGKTVIPIAERGATIKALQSLLPTSVPLFWLDPESPWRMEEELTRFLERERVSKDTKQAILAVAGVAIGLVLLQELTKS
jgi:pyrroline-5-carboxylate reductase